MQPMQDDVKMRITLAALVYSMTNAVIFGAGLITVLLLPQLSGQRMIAIPVVVVASLILAAPAAWLIAPRLRLRYWKARRDSRPRLEIIRG